MSETEDDILLKGKLEIKHIKPKATTDSCQSWVFNLHHCLYQGTWWFQNNNQGANICPSVVLLWMETATKELIRTQTLHTSKNKQNDPETTSNKHGHQTVC